MLYVLAVSASEVYVAAAFSPGVLIVNNAAGRQVHSNRSCWLWAGNQWLGVEFHAQQAPRYAK
jgi:hypothetical protein